MLLVAAVAGYAAGSVSPATWLARGRGVDLRSVGSGNPGAANAGRALGRRTGVVVAGLDSAKGLVPAAVFGLLDHRAGLVAGVAAVLGHVSSPLLRGRGGKGVATTFGVVVGTHPGWAPVLLLTWVLVLAATRWIALASVCAALALPVVAAVLGQDVLWAAVLFAVVLVRHRSNFARGWRGSSRRPPDAAGSR